MRTSLMLSLLASTSLATACGGGAPKTPQEVGDRVLAALSAKDWEKAKALFWSVDDFNSKCPDFPEEKKKRMPEEFAEELADAEQDFKKCLETDWANGKITEVKGGEPDDALPGCDGKVMEAKDVMVQVEVGGKKMEIKVNDPAKVGDNYFLVEGFRCKAPEMSCEDVYDHLSKLVSAASDAKDRDKEMFTGTAEKKSEFARMCDMAKSEPQFTKIMTCMSGAASYADMKACEKSMDEGGGAKEEAVVAAAAPPAGAVTGACDKYTTKMIACADAMPEPAREQMKKGLETMKGVLGNRSPDEQNTACGAALEAAKKSMAAMCPNVAWD